MHKKDIRDSLVAGICRFLSEDGLVGLKNEERESIEIAIQCLESVFNTKDVKEVPDIKNCLVVVQVDPELKEKAERLKAEGNAYLTKKLYDEAKHCYEQAIKADPTNPVYHSNLAAAHTALSEFEEAAQASQNAVDLDPSYSKAWTRLGTALIHLNRDDEARDALIEAERLDPTNDQIKQTLASIVPKKSKAMPGLADMMGGMGGMDIGKMMADPNFMQMASQFMQSGAMNDLMKDPSALQDLLRKK